MDIPFSEVITQGLILVVMLVVLISIVLFRSESSKLKSLFRKSVEVEVEPANNSEEVSCIQFHLTNGEILQFNQIGEDDTYLIELFVACQEISLSGKGLPLHNTNTAYWLLPSSITHCKLINIANAKDKIKEARERLKLI